jgi:hypothetical protein
LSDCTSAGIEASSETECEAQRVSCEQSAKPASADIDCMGASTEGLEGCSITVGELADCLDELAGYLTGLSCKDAGKPFTLPACFNSVSASCGALFGS